MTDTRDRSIETLRVRLTERTQEVLLRQYDSEYDASALNLGDFREPATQIVAELMPRIVGLLAGTANTTDAEEDRPTVTLAQLIASWDQGVQDTDRIPHWATNLAMEIREKYAPIAEVAKLRAERDRLIEAHQKQRRFADQNYEFWRRAERERGHEMVRADRAVADLAALQDRVRALADEWESHEAAGVVGYGGFGTELRALLGDGGDQS